MTTAIWESRMKDFTGRAAFVTGGSRGVGRAIALAFAAPTLQSSTNRGARAPKKSRPRSRRMG